MEQTEPTCKRTLPVVLASLASEVLEMLPEAHSSFGQITDAKAQAHLALGDTARALARYTKHLQRQTRLARAEPSRAYYQRDLSITFGKMGDLYRTLGQSDQAFDFLLQSLAIFQKLARAEPDRADYRLESGPRA